jgi:hypothetical protein
VAYHGAVKKHRGCAPLAVLWGDCTVATPASLPFVLPINTEGESTKRKHGKKGGKDRREKREGTKREKKDKKKKNEGRKNRKKKREKEKNRKKTEQNAEKGRRWAVARTTTPPLAITDG